jgi:hypothetical protein
MTQDVYPIDPFCLIPYNRDRVSALGGADAMLNREFPVPLEKWMTKIAVLAIIVGALLVAFVDWKIIGGVIIAYGVLTLFMAYHMGAAPCLEEVDRDVYIVKTKKPTADPADGEEAQTEWLAESNIQNVAN